LTHDSNGTYDLLPLRNMPLVLKDLEILSHGNDPLTLVAESIVSAASPKRASAT
jgi:hypothetical protein